MAHEVRRQSAQIRVVPDLERVSLDAAEQFAQLAQQQVQGGGRFSVALSGGSTPRRLYELLASDPYRRQIPWEHVHVFWTDERCVPSGHSDSNFRIARDLLLSRVPLPAVNVYQVSTERGDPMRAATLYEQTLRAFFQLQDDAWPAFDLVLLGLGEDGHAASLFPRSAALRETRRLVTPTSGGHPDLPRVTLTVPVLNHALHVVWLVAGSEKAPAVHAVLEGPQRPEEWPAQLVRPAHGAALWLLDRAAASLLRSCFITEVLQNELE